MLYFIVDEFNEVVEIASYVTPERRSNVNWLGRNDFNTLERAEAVAESATKFSGKLHIATETPNCWPRFDVIEAPAVGTEVSYTFNGDYYPCGKIVKVSKSLQRVTTDTGRVFNRVKSTGCWLSDGMWSMISGHVDRRNMEF